MFLLAFQTSYWIKNSFVKLTNWCFCRKIESFFSLIFVSFKLILKLFRPQSYCRWNVMGVLISFVLFCFLFVSGFVIYLCRYPKKYFIFVICCLILTWLTITDNFGYLTIPSFIRCLSVHPLTFPFSAFLPFFIPYSALALELNSHCSTWFWSTIFSTYWPIMFLNMFY